MPQIRSASEDTKRDARARIILARLLEVIDCKCGINTSIPKCSLARNYNYRKVIVRNPNPIRQPNTFGSDHGWTMPPHCRAKFRHDMAPSSRIAPGYRVGLSSAAMAVPLSRRVEAFLKVNQTRTSPTAPKSTTNRLSPD